MLLAKHRGCTMPGCDASAYRSQVHHANQGWKDGGRTDIEDLTLACGPNNRMVETAGWSTRNRPDDGVTEWTLNGEVKPLVGLFPVRWAARCGCLGAGRRARWCVCERGG
jgi:hypothetical protein